MFVISLIVVILILLITWYSIKLMITAINKPFDSTKLKEHLEKNTISKSKIRFNMPKAYTQKYKINRVKKF